MSLEQKVDQLMQDLVLLVGKVEQRMRQSEQAYSQTSQTLARAESHFASAGHDIVQTTNSALGDALKQPVGERERDLKNIRNDMRNASKEVSQSVAGVAQTLKRYTWVSIGTLVLATVLSLGVIAYSTMQAQKEVNNAKWIGDINAAVTVGKLAPSPGNDGGLCALVDKKYVRLDK